MFDTPGHMKGLVPVVEYKKEKKTEQFLFSFNRPRITQISWKNMRHYAIKKLKRYCNFVVFTTANRVTYSVVYKFTVINLYIHKKISVHFEYIL